jgi:xanthine dehydrogenase YagR molybdenum-binding subunit
MVENLAAAFAPPSAGPRGATDSQRGDFDRAIATAAHHVRATYTTPNENHNPMEPHTTVAVWQGPDQLTLYDTTQGVFGCRQRLAEILGIPKQNVRVISHFVGGAFGCKGTPWSHVALCALAAKVAGRPVKLAVTRQQMFSFVGHRPQTIQTLGLGCDDKGKLVALRHESISETSSFDDFVEAAATTSRHLYQCDNVTTSHRLVRVDAGTPTFQRAPGESTGTYALECAMDELAFAAGVDPLELRVRNYAAIDDDKHKPYSSKSLRDCYLAAAQKFGWGRRSVTPRSMRAGNELVGYGMATATYPANMMPASARVSVRRDGSVLVQCGTQDIGTGTYTVMSQLAADTLGVPTHTVTLELGDTQLPDAPLSAGSMTAASVGSAIHAACEALVAELAKVATADERSPLRGLPVASAHADTGEVVIGPAREPMAQIVERSGRTEISGEANTVPAPTRDHYSCHAFGAAFAEVRVDENLGMVRVARLVGAFACGRFMNRKTARSQLLGGMVWAIGMALEEHTVRDRRTARVVTRDLADYHVPVNADVPDIDVIMIDEHDPYVDRIGVKGCGEIGLTGTTAAIANAVYHATGKRVRDLPITLDKLL